MAGEAREGDSPSASVAPLASVRMTINWMRRPGTGTGFACVKLSEILPLGFAMCKLFKRIRDETDWGRI
jgi:hypothetical protein